MTYDELIAEAKNLYYKIACNSPFVAKCQNREFIASKIDECTDRNEHMDILEWDEYKENYAPISKATYERRKRMAKENYEATIAQIEKDYEERGKFSPDYHKI